MLLRHLRSGTWPGFAWILVDNPERQPTFPGGEFYHCFRLQVGVQPVGSMTGVDFAFFWLFR